MNRLVISAYIAARASPSLALFMQEQSRFSWLQGFVIPVLFTCFGAALGFFASLFHDDWNARRAKKSFMRAVGMELDALGVQLTASLHAVTESIQRVERGGTGGRFAGIPRRSVFNSQIGKLRDIDDPKLIKISHFYSDLGIIEQIFKDMGVADDRYNQATSDMQKTLTRNQLLSTLRVLQEQILGFSRQLEKLRAELPTATSHK